MISCMQLEDEKLVGHRDEYDVRPFIPVIRDKDVERLADSVQKHTREFSAVVESTLPDIEKMVSALPVADAANFDPVLTMTVVVPPAAIVAVQWKRLSVVAGSYSLGVHDQFAGSGA